MGMDKMSLKKKKKQELFLVNFIKMELLICNKFLLSVLQNESNGKKD